MTAARSMSDAPENVGEVYIDRRCDKGAAQRPASVLHRTVDSHHVATSGASPVASCNLEIQGFRDLPARMVRSRSSTLTTSESRGGYQASDSEH
jgi:hypothetical protein